MREFVIGLVVGILLAFFGCYMIYQHQLDKVNEELADMTKARDSANVVIQGLMADVADLQDTADTSAAVAEPLDEAAQAAAAERWRERERVKIRTVFDERVAFIVDSLGREHRVEVPEEILAEVEACRANEATQASARAANKKALEDCQEASAGKDRLVTAMTGKAELDSMALHAAFTKIALLEAKKGLKLIGPFRLQMPSFRAGMGLVYNIDCPDPSSTTSLAVSQEEFEQRTPIEYPHGFHDFAGSTFPKWVPPIETVDRTVTIDRIITTQQSSGCQRWVYGPSAQLSIIKIEF